MKRSILLLILMCIFFTCVHSEEKLQPLKKPTMEEYETNIITQGLEKLASKNTTFFKRLFCYAKPIKDTEVKAEMDVSKIVKAKINEAKEDIYLGVLKIKMDGMDPTDIMVQLVLITKFQKQINKNKTIQRTYEVTFQHFMDNKIYMGKCRVEFTGEGSTEIRFYRLPDGKKLYPKLA